MSDKHLDAIMQFADPNVRPQDDLFRAINGKWLDETVIPDDLPSYGSFVKLRLQADDDVHTIVRELSELPPLSKDALSGEAKIVRDLYSSWMDTESMNRRGLSSLYCEIDLLDGAQTKRELAIAIGTLMRWGVGTFFDLDVDSDLNDPNHYTTFLVQSGLGLPDEAYYREEKHADTLNAYAQFLPSILAHAYTLDEDEAQRWARVVVDYETKIAQTHMSVTDSRNTDNTNNPMSFADFTALAPGFEWETALRAAGFPEGQPENVLVFQPDTLKQCAALWEQAPLEDLKIYHYWRLLRARSAYLGEELDALSFNFYGKILSGTPTQRERWKRGISLINSSIGQAVGKLYVERHFPPHHKQAMLELVEDLLLAYRQSISTLDWMGDETKKRALEKLDSFKTKIGYPDVWIDYSSLETCEDLVANIRAVQEFEFNRALAKLGTEVDRTEWHMPPQTVNAYYNPVWNEIVFPAAILQSPFFDPERDAALNYGGIGAVIGHEIGHGFDDQGAKYDATGALRDWWTDEDLESFRERTKALIAQYDAYVPAQFPADSPHHVQGALTIGENIGDLGGLAIAVEAYTIALQREGLSLESAPSIDGLSAAQRLFFSFAHIWREKRRDEFMRHLLAIDPHSPTEFRCNGVVRNIDAFAKAFDVREGDGLYLAPDERVHIWQ
ncbi:MAG: peptidase M13 [Actinomycetaceae bacterium]|nr:peptidase M13 [Actinomycetaceae bacterium]